MEVIEGGSDKAGGSGAEVAGSMDVAAAGGDGQGDLLSLPPLPYVSTSSSQEMGGSPAYVQVVDGEAGQGQSQG